MGQVADVSCINFNTLNVSKGESIQGLRQQIDRDKYKLKLQQKILNLSNLHIQEARYLLIHAASKICCPRMTTTQ